MKLPAVYEHLENNLGTMFADEVKRLMDSGGVGPVSEDTAHCTIIRVALENIAERWDKGMPRSYNNLKRF